MNRLIALLTFLVLQLACMAQDNVTLPPAAAVRDSAVSPQTRPLSRYQLKKPVYNVSVGMEFTTAAGYGSGFTQYVVPQVSLPVGKRIILSGGIMIANTNYFGAKPLYSGDLFQPYNGNFTSLTVFASGTYFVNDRLSVSGAFYKEIPVAGQQLSYSPYYPISRQGSQGFNMNVQYKIGEHMFIQAGFGVYQDSDPYRLNPFAPRMHGRGLGDFNFGGAPQGMYNFFSGQ